MQLSIQAFQDFHDKTCLYLTILVLNVVKVLKVVNVLFV